MARERSPIRDKAFKLWVKSGRTMKSYDIADKLGVSAEMVRKWKSLDRWDERPDPKRGAPRGNRNAVGNKGGPGGPDGNDKAVIHGLFRKFMPNDEETLAIFDATEDLDPLEILWMSIRIAWTNIVRSQGIQFVQDKQDETKVLKKSRNGKGGSENEWEYQHAWDKQAKMLTSQATAMKALGSKIKQYEDMLRALPPDEVHEEHKLRLQKLKVEVSKVGKVEHTVIFKGEDELED